MRKRSKSWMVSVVPGAAWQALLLLIPFCVIAAVSFLSRGEYGEIERPFTFENYRRLAGYDELGFDPIYPLTLLRTLGLALISAVICGLLAVPLGFFLAGLSLRAKLVAITALLIPVWTNLLVRTYAWQALLAPEGLITKIFRTVGLGREGEGLYPSWSAVFICLICDYLPFAALPIYASVEKLNWSLVEAAQDLGAGPWNTFRHGIWPQIRAGVIAGFLFVMLPALGQFVVPDLLGGAKTVLLGNLLQQQFGVSRDFPFGSAITVVTLVVVFAGMGLHWRNLSSSKEGA